MYGLVTRRSGGCTMQLSARFALFNNLALMLVYIPEFAIALCVKRMNLYLNAQIKISTPICSFSISRDSSFCHLCYFFLLKCKNGNDN
jgi:hypothetical protein